MMTTLTASLLTRLTGKKNFKKISTAFVMLFVPTFGESKRKIKDKPFF